MNTRQKILALLDEWQQARTDFAASLEKLTGEQKAEHVGWWDACCCIVQDLEELLEELENGT